jgi:hypothetical protein
MSHPMPHPTDDGRPTDARVTDDGLTGTPMSAQSRGSEAVARTVYLSAPDRGPAPGSLTARLAFVYLTSFVVTSGVILATWAGLRMNRPPPAPPPAPEVRIVEVEKQVPVPVPVPVPVEVAAPAPPSPAVRPSPAPRPSPRPPARPEPAPQPAPVTPAPAPVVVVKPDPAPVAPVAPAPASVTRLAGVYRGRGAGEDLLLELAFGADGKLTGRAARGGKTVDASGTWEQVGDVVSFVLLERSGDRRVAYSGSATGAGASGRMTVGGDNVGKFSVAR